MKQVKLDQFFIALALPKDGQRQSSPTESQLEQLRLATAHYLVRRLQPIFPTIATLELSFKNLACGSQKPEPRFQIYWEVDAIAHFTTAAKKKEKTKLPKPAEIFKAIGPWLDQEYFDYLRTVLSDSSPFAAAEEVTVRQLKQATAGGAVKAPPFYMGFVSEKRPDKPVTDNQIRKLVEYSHPKMTEQLQRTYPKDFQNMTLRVVKTEINESAGKPVDTFNVYVEFEATGTFSQNAPPPMQFFSDLASFGIIEFLMGLGGCLGGYFESASRMAINPCAWVDNEVEEMDDPAEDAKVVPVHVEFWVALVMPQQKKLPDKGQNTLFDEMIQDKFVSPILTRAYGAKKIVELDVKKDSCQFNAGVPLPRFNVLHRYKVDILMTNPIPLPTQILSKIIRGGNLLGNIIQMPSPWNLTTEVTLGVAGNENPGKEQVYGSKIQAPKHVVTPPVSPAPKTKKPKNKAKLPSKSVVKKPESPKPEPPKEALVLGADVFLALTIADLEQLREPTNDDYTKLQQATFGFYTEYLRELHGENFLKFEVSVKESQVNGSIPDDTYNVYVAWHLSATFADATKAPSRIVFCQQLVNDINTMEYLKNRVRSLECTPFEHAYRMYTEQIVTDRK